MGHRRINRPPLVRFKPTAALIDRRLFVQATMRHSLKITPRRLQTQPLLCAVFNLAACRL
jgi:hypothetical protein